VKEILIRTLTGISLILVFVGSLLLGPTSSLLVILIVYGLGTRELLSLLSVSKDFSVVLMLVSGGLFIAGVYAGLHLGIHPAWLLFPLIIWILAYLTRKGTNPGPLALIWMAFPLSAFMATGWIPSGSWNSTLPVAIISMVWINDTFAYLSGIILGKHPMTPKLSPGKTWEGFAGGVIFSALSGWVLYHITGLMNPVTWILAGTASSLFGLAGDLFESRLKRNNDLKDTGTLLPGHGGLLDRFDSLLFVSPALLLLFLLYHFLQ